MSTLDMMKIFLRSIINFSPKWHRWSFPVNSTIGIQYNINRKLMTLKMRQKSGQITTYHGHNTSLVCSDMILEIIAAVCLIGGGLLLVYKLLNDKRFFHNDSSGGGQKVFRGK